MLSSTHRGVVRFKRLLAAFLLATLFALSLSVGAAAPSHAQTSVTVSNGEMAHIQDNGTCTLTAISSSYLLTAGHCGQEGKTVSVYGQNIGKISYNGLQRGTGYDFAKIELNPGVTVVPTGANFNYTPSTGDTVSRTNFSAPQVDGRVSDPTLKTVSATLNGQKHNVKVWTAALESYEGNSGSPILYQGNVVGILKGGPTDNYQVTTVTPLSAIRSYL